MPEPIVVARGLRRTFGAGPSAVTAVADVDLVVPRGQLVAVQGRSGSGKTTLLNLVGGLETPDAGTVHVDGHDLAGLDEQGRLRLRRQTVGFVFQSFGLIPILTAAENVGVPMRLEKVAAEVREKRVDLLLRLVGLSEQARQRPGELSGGQQQRVAVARALANEPPLIIADEPTGQLDSQTGLAVMTLLQALVRERGVTVLVATHDPTLLGLADRVVELSDGKVRADTVRDGAGAQSTTP